MNHAGRFIGGNPRVSSSKQTGFRTDRGLPGSNPESPCAPWCKVLCNPFAFNVGFESRSAGVQLAHFPKLCCADRTNDIEGTLNFGHPVFVVPSIRELLFPIAHPTPRMNRR